MEYFNSKLFDELDVRVFDQVSSHFQLVGAQVILIVCAVGDSVWDWLVAQEVRVSFSGQGFNFKLTQAAVRVAVLVKVVSWNLVSRVHDDLCLGASLDWDKHVFNSEIVKEASLARVYHVDCECEIIRPSRKRCFCVVIRNLDFWA